MAEERADLSPTSIVNQNQAPFYAGSSIGVTAGVANQGLSVAPTTALAYWVSRTENGDPIDANLVAINTMHALLAGDETD